MLISSWLTSFRSRLQERPRMVKRRLQTGRASRTAENLEIRSMLTSLVAVRPNVGAFLSPDETRPIAPQELTLQFGLGEAIDINSISTSSIQLQRAGHDGTFDDGNEVPVSIGYIGIGNEINEVVMRFAENLPDDRYRITVKGTGTTPLTSNGGTVFNGGADTTFDFNLDLGAQIVAVDPQPVTGHGNGTVSQPRRDQVILYFNEDKLDPDSAENVSFYQLIFTNDTISLEDEKPERAGHVQAARGQCGTYSRSSLSDYSRGGPGQQLCHRQHPAGHDQRSGQSQSYCARGHHSSAVPDHLARRRSLRTRPSGY